MRELKIFSGRANEPLADKICQHLHLDRAAISLGKFPDGENFCKLEEDVRGRDVFLVQPTSPPVNDNLLELLVMIDCCMRASAERITAVIPYFGYARQDRKDEGRVPITAKLVANLITRAGADRVLTMDLHAAQIQGFFDVPVDHLYAAPVLNEYYSERDMADDKICVVSPDEGSIKRAVGHGKRLGGSLAIVDKRRTSATEVRQSTIIGGPVEGKIALLFDDMISTADRFAVQRSLSRSGRSRDPHCLYAWSPLRQGNRKHPKRTRRLDHRDRYDSVVTRQDATESETADCCTAAGRGDQTDSHDHRSASCFASVRIDRKAKETWFNC